MSIKEELERRKANQNMSEARQNEAHNAKFLDDVVEYPFTDGIFATLKGVNTQVGMGRGRQLYANGSRMESYSQKSFMKTISRG